MCCNPRYLNIILDPWSNAAAERVHTRNCPAQLPLLPPLHNIECLRGLAAVFIEQDSTGPSDASLHESVKFRSS